MAEIQTFDHRLMDVQDPTDQQLLGSIVSIRKAMNSPRGSLNEGMVQAMLSGLPNLHALGLETLAYIDDEREKIERVVPQLVVATRARTVFLLEQGCSVEEACDAIRSCKPQLVLVDGILTNVTIHGKDIVKALSDEIACVGFSSGEYSRKAMKENGAIDAIDKCGGDELIAELAQILSRSKPR